MEHCNSQHNKSPIQTPNTVGSLENAHEEQHQHTNEEFHENNEIVAQPTNSESANIQRQSAKSENLQNELLQEARVPTLDLSKLSSDELLILADSQLLNLKINPLPIELYLPNDIGSLHIPGTPETTNGTSLNAKVNSICDALEFKTNSSGRFVAELFVELPLKEEYPDYYSIIRHPICINDIRKRQYNNAQAMIEDFALMFNNARVYNTKGSTVYQDSIELQTEFGRELQLLFPDETKDLAQQLANICRSSDTKKEKQFRRSPPRQEELKESVVDENKARANTPRFKHATWLKRKEDNFFVYGSGSETEVTSGDERSDVKRRKKEAASRKGKLVGGR